MRLFDFFKKKDSGFDLDKVLQMDDRNSAVIELDTRVNELSEYGADLSKLTGPQKVLLFVENLEREVNNGGFNQFYWNSSGGFAHETLAGIRIIGANKMADILAKANSVWPNQAVPKGQTERQEVMETMEEQANAIWEQCDKDFFKCPDDISELLLEYVKQNKSDFE